MVNIDRQRCRSALMLLCVVLASLTFAMAADKQSDAPTPTPSEKKPAATRAAHPDTPAWRAFGRFKQLAGQRWEGTSTKGWTERLTYTLIAGDSVVMEQSQMAHDTAMVTMYSMDGDELYLTHYCAARNVPRMRATKISDDGGDVLFEFVDGLNLKAGPRPLHRRRPDERAVDVLRQRQGTVDGRDHLHPLGRRR
jgi:hypothetical protein